MAKKHSHSIEWKAKKIRQRKRLHIIAGNTGYSFKLEEDVMSLKIGGKTYYVRNPGSTLYALIRESSFFLVEIANPDKDVGSLLILTDITIYPRIW